MPSGTMTADPSIPREDPDLLTGELDLLGQYLDYHRATLAMKCARLSETDLKRRAVPTSSLTLLGLVRHLTEVEYGWFCEWLDGQPERAVYFSDDDPDGDFDNVAAVTRIDAFAAWQAECDNARTVAARMDLTDVGTRRGEEVSLRWVLVHMIEEYARHNGHADLLREQLDGAVGE